MQNTRKIAGHDLTTMNARGPGGRGRRPERENTRSEPKPDSERLKNDMKSDGPRDRGKSLDKSPPRGRFDPRRDTRIPGKPRDRDGKQVFKRKEPGRNPNFKGGKYEIASRSHHLDHPHYRDHRDRDGYRERESYRSSSHDHGMKPGTHTLFKIDNVKISRQFPDMKNSYIFANDGISRRLQSCNI